MARSNKKKKQQRSQQNKQANLAIGLIAVGGFIILAALILLISKNQPIQTQAAQPPTEAIPYPNITRVSVEDAKTAFDEGKAIFLDIRGPAVYDAGHIPGAVLVTIDEVESRLREFDKEKWIITYCT